MRKSDISLATKRRLAASLKRLMGEKSFEKITVVDLLEDCDISRSTFYYHFNDIYDLLQWMFEDECLGLVDVPEDGSPDLFGSGLYRALEYAYRNKDACQRVCRSLSRDRLRSIFFDRFSLVTRAYVEREVGKVPASPEQVDFVVDFYSAAFAGMIMKWIWEGMDKTPEEMVRLFEIAARGAVPEALRRGASNRF